MTNALVQYGTIAAYSGIANSALRRNDNYPVAVVQLEETAFPEGYRNSVSTSVAMRTEAEQHDGGVADLPLRSNFGEGLRHANLKFLQY